MLVEDDIQVLFHVKQMSVFFYKRNPKSLVPWASTGTFKKISFWKREFFWGAGETEVFLYQINAI